MATPLSPDDPASLGAYRLAGRLGEGGQGVVYLAHDRDGQPVAIKLLSTGDQETRTRLARELDALESIASFCTARVLDVSTGGQRPYVVSEFVEGLSLLDRVKERGPLRGGDLERLAVGTATALAAIHAAGIVHRDFKPANVLLGPDGPRVVDFGIARAEGAATMTSGLIGTPAYLSPEQIGGSPASPASDVFAWAATMVFAATGRSPFGADTVPAVLHRVLQANPDLSALPPRLQGMLGACLSKDPGFRPSAKELMVLLVNPTSAPFPGAPGGGFPGGVPGGGFPGGVPGGTTGVATGGSAGVSTGFGGAERTGPQASAVTTGVPRRRGSRGLLLGLVAVVVALAAAGGAIYWVNRAPATTNSASTAPRDTETERSTGQSTDKADDRASDKATDDASDQPTDESSEQATQKTDSAGGLKIPAAFAGTWSGHTQSTLPSDTDGATNTVELRTGRSTGRWTEKDTNASCTGSVTLTKVSANQLTFSLQPDSIDCVAGTVWLTLKGGKLVYLWRDTPGLNMARQTGELGKS
ncbi:serine/threonine-protein kinase [Nonomuraea rhizosphaerae]|uniref:serine/threonine-protein kinase n=1 Tax=Nonomuraea rhizosphaerae TaxID=2665663 RepID=UPI001C5FFB0B|nr:serine/threonine-protein kinase [Nonomuraea rhizosphaerae]